MTKSAVTWPPLKRPVTSAVRAALPTGARAHPFVARFLPRSGVVEAPLPDGRIFRMWSQGDDDIATTLFWRDGAGHEPDTTVAFYERAVSARTALDIGDHVGYFAVLAGLANPGGQVFAFEPLDRVRERLTGNVDLNGLTSVQCRSVALGRGPGTACEVLKAPPASGSKRSSATTTTSSSSSRRTGHASVTQSGPTPVGTTS